MLGQCRHCLGFYSGFISIGINKPKSYLGVKKVFNNKFLRRNLLFMQYNALLIGDLKWRVFAAF